MKKNDTAKKNAEKNKNGNNRRGSKKPLAIAVIIALLAVLGAVGINSVNDNSASIFNPPVQEQELSVISQDEAPAAAEEKPESNANTGNEAAGASEAAESDAAGSFDPDSVPAYADAQSAYIAVNNNIPFFTKADMTTDSFEEYSSLDSLGRCGTAYACVGKDLMPTEKRGSIGSVKPSGWNTVKYDNVDGKYLYNRCHLIGYQLTAENANEKNLITGTRYLNIEGMLPFENMTADYVKETGHHVLYRVTPVFKGNDLLAEGVLMEGKSVEDDEIEFCVFCYNVQPGITIEYATGKSQLAGSDAGSGSGENAAAENSSSYVLNTSSKKFHLPSCKSVSTISPENKETFTGSREELIEKGYTPCGSCHP